jgi:hypothetical protein
LNDPIEPMDLANMRAEGVRSLAIVRPGLGLKPKAADTGTTALNWEKRNYLRVLFVQAAWVVLLQLKSWDECTGDRRMQG